VQGVSTRSVDDLVQAMGMTRHLQEPGQPPGRRDRRAGCKAFLEPPDRGRLALCLARRHLREGPPGWPHRLGRRHHRRGRQHRWPARGPRPGYRRLGSRDLLDSLPAQADAAGLARREAGGLRRPRGPQGGRSPRCWAPPGSAAACTSCGTLWRMRERAAGAWSPPSSPPPSPRTMRMLPMPSGAPSPTSCGPKLPKLSALPG